MASSVDPLHQSAASETAMPPTIENQVATTTPQSIDAPKAADAIPVPEVKLDQMPEVPPAEPAKDISGDVPPVGSNDDAGGA